MSKHGSLKRGETREDGMVFLRYTYKGKEVWVSHAKLVEFYEHEKQKKLTNKEELKEKAKIYRTKNRERLLNYSKDYRRKNRKKCNERLKRWRLSNKAKDLQMQRNYYYKNRKKRCDQSWKYQKKRKEKDSLFKMKINTRVLILNSFKKNGYKKSSKLFGILGCSFEEFKAHIESQFLPMMSWDNRSEWHIDHIMPVSMANTYDEVVRLNHYKNLRPMWASDNLRKSDKIGDTLVLF